MHRNSFTKWFYKKTFPPQSSPLDPEKDFLSNEAQRFMAIKQETAMEEEEELEEKVMSDLGFKG